MAANPFIPGARVAIVVSKGWRAPNSFKSGTVAKVLKSGNFTLEGSAQQWRPFHPSSYEDFWRAAETGAGNQSLRIWDETTNAGIVEKNAAASRYHRFERARLIIDREHFSELMTEEVIEKMEAIAAAIKPREIEPSNG